MFIFLHTKWITLVFILLWWFFLYFRLYIHIFFVMFANFFFVALHFSLQAASSTAITLKHIHCPFDLENALPNTKCYSSLSVLSRFVIVICWTDFNSFGIGPAQAKYNSHKQCQIIYSHFSSSSSLPLSLWFSLIHATVAFYLSLSLFLPIAFMHLLCLEHVLSQFKFSGIWKLAPIRHFHVRALFACCQLLEQSQNYYIISVYYFIHFIFR